MRGLLVPLLFCSTVFVNGAAWADRPFEPAAKIATLSDGLAALARPGAAVPRDAVSPSAAVPKVLLVEVTAEWCRPCQQLGREVLDTPTWAEVVGDDVALRIDFESDEGQAVKRRFGVLGLPTLLVVRADGTEIGRVEGYPGRREWVDALGDVRAGRSGLAALKKAYAADPKNDVLALELAQARLVSGDLAALSALDELIASDTDIAAHAARVKGRWLLRVREDGEPARAHFEAMVKRFAATKHRGHFIYWQANALEHLKRRDEALALFQAWRAEAGQNTIALAYQADFMVHHAIPGAVAVARAHHTIEPSAESHYALSKALAQAGEQAAALEHARAAVALEPSAALFANHLRGLGGP